MTTWSAPVRYAEVDQQGIVFNSHYLLYCDEAMTAYCTERDLLAFAEQIHLVASSLHWRKPARWGDLVEVDATCRRIGSSSLEMHFDITVGTDIVCTVDTTYVFAADGRSRPIPDDIRALLG
jgi:acyl-CoA thioester hydrolase